MLTVDSSWLLLCLCILCHAVVGRLPASAWLNWFACLLWLFAIALVIWALVHKLLH